MIYTLTLNPAVDYTLHLENLTPDSIIRSQSEDISFGGKGINASLVLKELGVNSTALGFVGGFTGLALEQSIACKEIKTDFVHLKRGNTRINVKIRDGRETDINAKGPQITDGDLEALFKKISPLREGDMLILSGSLPKGVPTRIYGQLMARLKGGKAVVDTTGEALLSCLGHRPFLVKPNAEELGEIFQAQIDTKEKALYFARELQKMGAENVLVSMGHIGAVLLTETGEELFRKALPITPKSSVGAGDSMLAGFIAGYLERTDFEYALRLGTACGAATAQKDGLAKRDEIAAMLDLDCRY